MSKPHMPLRSWPLVHKRDSAYPDRDPLDWALPDVLQPDGTHPDAPPADAIPPAEDCGGTPTEEQIWQWLSQVPDPEIPALSILDLGIVRTVRQESGAWVVTITPTYSGCPATAVIAGSIRSRLRQHGLIRLHIRVALSPPWTTGWMSEAAREKLKATGIAPPCCMAGKATVQAVQMGGSVPHREVLASETYPVFPLHPLVLHPSCPQCDSPHTECVSAFGSTPCKSLYRCLTCLEPFEYFKCH